MRRLAISLALLFIFLGVEAVRAETTLWVKTPHTIVKLTKDASSPVIAKLKRGTPLEILKEDGKFYQVRMQDGKTGWVFRFKLTEEKPGGDWGLFESMDNLFEEPTVEEASSSASIRGLSKVSENHAVRQKIRPEHIRAVKEIERFPTSQDEIIQFLKEGKLGEYAQ